MNGPVWLLPDTDGSIEAESFEVVTDDSSVKLNLPSPSVTAIGTVAMVVGRDIHIDVGAYSRVKHANVTYQIVVTIPDNNRRTNSRLPQAGGNVAICGFLTYIAVHEEYEVPEIEMENIVFLPRTDFMRKNDVSTGGGKAKRQLLSEKISNEVDIGQPMKKMKSGPAEAFTPEELSGGSSSQASSGSSSQASVGSSSPPSISSSSRTTRSTANSSQSSANGSASPSRKADRLKGSVGKSNVSKA
ncbi:hypothetical protein FRC11_014211 [Ceratobasidium sp. 423]|nr:hypothetical protein FRC11_014211 [Ceratobasidium sp. 423]